MTLRSGIISLAVLCSSGCSLSHSTASSPATNRFALTISGNPADSAAPVSVRLDLPARSDSATLLELPNEYAGRSRLYENIVDLRTPTPGARLESTTHPNEVRLIAPPNAPSSVTWSLRATPPSSSSPGAHNFSDIGRGVAQLVGTDALVLPALRADMPVEAHIRFTLPSGAGHVATSFGPPRGSDSSITVRDMVGSVRHALYTFALDSTALRERRTLVGGGTLTVLIRGHHAIPDSDLVAGVQRVISVERGFWQAPAPAEYLVSIGVGPRGSIGGQRLANAFEADIDSMRTMDVDVLELFAHELMHEWIGSGRMHASWRLRDGELSWFTEGFDEFETHRVMRAGGFLDDSEYVARVNKVIADHSLSPARDSSAAAILGGFWRDGSMQREPYLRGELLALRLNSAVERATHGSQSLDSLLKRMYLRADGDDAGYTRDRLIREFGAVIGDDVARTEIDRVINGGATELPDGALGRCAESRMESLARWDPGFDVDATLAAKRTAGVRPGGPAAMAGMRDAMPVTSVNIYRNDTNRPIELGVRTDTGVVKLRYPPTGEKVPVQRWSLRATCRDTASRPHAHAAADAATGVSRADSGLGARDPRFIPLAPFPGDVQLLLGNPDSAGPFVMRINELAGTIVPPHSHPVDEHITVVKGTWWFGVGERYDSTALHALPTGAYAFAPAGTTMFAASPEAAVVQVSGIGPFQITWRDGLATLDQPGSTTFHFRRGDTVSGPRGVGVILEGYASGVVIQYEVQLNNGQHVMASERDLRRENTVPPR